VEAVTTSAEASVNFHETTRRYIPEDCHLQRTFHDQHNNLTLIVKFNSILSPLSVITTKIISGLHRLHFRHPTSSITGIIPVYGAILFFNMARKQICCKDVISGPHGGAYDDIVSGCDAVYTRKEIPTFRRTILPPSSGLMIKATFYLPTSPHSFTAQNNVVMLLRVYIS
jgi:hypothetical protein